MLTFLGALHSEKSFLVRCLPRISSIHPCARQFQGLYLEIIYCVYIVLYIYEHSEANLNISLSCTHIRSTRYLALLCSLLYWTDPPCRLYCQVSWWWLSWQKPQHLIRGKTESHQDKKNNTGFNDCQTQTSMYCVPYSGNMFRPNIIILRPIM